MGHWGVFICAVLVGEPFDDFPASPRPVSSSINAGLQQASRVDVVRVFVSEPAIEN